MKQVLQSLKNGATEVADAPCPALGAGQLLIMTSCTLVSPGTERMALDFGRGSWIERARQQPDKVRMVLDKVKVDGLIPTVEAVRHKLDQPLALGYCNVGRIVELGSGVTGFEAGERVVSNGRHAAAVCVPVNLCAKIPDPIGDDEAAFTVLGAVALQGIRLAQPTLGEAVVVTGLGLVGLLTVQLLRGSGCRVLGLDFDPARLELARRFGAEVIDLASGEDPVSAAARFSRGRGVDAVLITASTKSNEPMHQAALMCRKRGRIVLVGVTGLELSRADFYEKELTFQVSCSYGPGRYDPSYEEEGQDYPVGFVRWTMQRNFEAVLDMLADRRLDVRPLISHRFRIDAAEAAYDLVGGGGPSLGVLLEFPPVQDLPDADLRSQTLRLAPHAPPSQDTTPAKLSLAVVGSGNFATAVLIPAFKAAGASLITVASRGGVSGLHAGRKFGFREVTTDTDSIFESRDTDTLVITTRHDSHARLVCRALQAGKHVFVEKPLALTLEELEAIEQAYRAAAAGPRHPLLMVGFNRRFAPQTRQIKALLAGVGAPKAFIMTVNAGAIPSGHWTQDRQAGGGRIIGEACHFVDLLRFLAGAPITSSHAVAMAGSTPDTASLQLGFADGSVGTIHYLANGHRGFPKERLEVFCAGRVLQLDNFRKVTAFGWPGFAGMRSWRQDKGHQACAAAFAQAVRDGGPSPIGFAELMEVSRLSIELGRI